VPGRGRHEAKTPPNVGSGLPSRHASWASQQASGPPWVWQCSAQVLQIQQTSGLPHASHTTSSVGSTPVILADATPPARESFCECASRRQLLGDEHQVERGVSNRSIRSRGLVDAKGRRVSSWWTSRQPLDGETSSPVARASAERRLGRPLLSPSSSMRSSRSCWLRRARSSHVLNVPARARRRGRQRRHEGRVPAALPPSRMKIAIFLEAHHRRWGGPFAPIKP
jgi:hypothetical protein